MAGRPGQFNPRACLYSQPVDPQNEGRGTPLSAQVAESGWVVEGMKHTSPSAECVLSTLWEHIWDSRTKQTAPPRGLCTCCFHGCQCPFPNSSYIWILVIQVPAQMLCPQKDQQPIIIIISNITSFCYLYNSGLSLKLSFIYSFSCLFFSDISLHKARNLYVSFHQHLHSAIIACQVQVRLRGQAWESGLKIF